MKIHHLSLLSRRLLIAFGASIAFAAISYGQAVITTGDGNGADTYLTNDANSGPDAVHGESASLNLRGFDGVRARTILIRFDVSDYVPESLTNGTISLNFTASNRDRSWTVYGLTDDSVANWEEATTSYSNAPGILPADPGFTGIDTNAWSDLGSFGVTSGTGVQTTDPVTLDLDGYLTGNSTGLASFLFHFTSGDSNPDWFVSSKEGDIAPALNLPDAQLVPEPSTYAAIFGVAALLGALYFRRKKNS